MGNQNRQETAAQALRRTYINSMLIVAALAVSLFSFVGLMSAEQATAQNVQSVYLSIHGGGK